MLPVVVIGGGGHARVLVDSLLESGRVLCGYTVDHSGPEHQPIFGVPCLGDDASLRAYAVSAIELVNGIGSTSSTETRTKLFQQFQKAGYRFATVKHPSAIVSRRAVLGEGVQIMAGAVIQANVSIGANVIINTRTSVDHDCTIEDHVHLAPGVTLSGSVHVGQQTHIGTGATVIQGIRIGEKCVIAAGAVVTRDVPDGAFILGVPGKERQR